MIIIQNTYYFEGAQCIRTHGNNVSSVFVIVYICRWSVPLYNRVDHLACTTESALHDLDSLKLVSHHSSMDAM